MNSRRAFIKSAVPVVAAAVLGLAVSAEDDYGSFLRTLHERIKCIVMRERAGVKAIRIEPVETINGEQFRFVRLWLDGLTQPFTWHHPYSGGVKPLYF